MCPSMDVDEEVAEEDVAHSEAGDGESCQIMQYSTAPVVPAGMDEIRTSPPVRVPSSGPV